jgi:iron(III) transport system substrate-binding protein
MMFRGLLAASALVLACASGAFAQTAADVAALKGPDRMEKLIQGAKREAQINIYTSATLEDMTVISGAFEKKYGVKVKLWRGSSEDLSQRTLAEFRAGRSEVDTYETTGLAMEMFHREGVLQAIDTPPTANLMPQASFPHKEWVATRLNIFAMAYNTNSIAKKDAPTKWEDLLDPKFKNKIAVEDGSIDWFSSIVTAMGEEKGLKFFRDVVQRNGISVRKGYTLLANLIASGEVPLSMTAYDNRITLMKSEGAPVELIYMPPVFGQPTGIGVAKRAPHPHAAVLFYEFMLDEGQKLYHERGVNPTNTKIKPLPAGVEIKFVDFPQLLDHADKWTKLYREIFVARR